MILQTSVRCRVRHLIMYNHVLHATTSNVRYHCQDVCVFAICCAKKHYVSLTPYVRHADNVHSSSEIRSLVAVDSSTVTKCRVYPASVDNSDLNNARVRVAHSSYIC